MSGLMGNLKEAASDKMGKDAQPGNNVEAKADNVANNKLNQTATNAGVPQSADSTIDNVADKKINSDIPGGN